MLWLDDDVASITSVKVDAGGDGTFELTLAENTDYWAYPFNRPANTPIIGLRLNPLSTQLTRWPRQARRVQVVGMKGYSYELEAVGTLGADLSDSALTGTLTAGHNIGVADTMVIGTEQIDVTVVATNAVTIVRGINGSTAAAHTSGAQLYRRRFPREIEAATTMQAARMVRETQTGFSGALGGGDARFAFRATYPAIQDALAPFVAEQVS